MANDLPKWVLPNTIKDIVAALPNSTNKDGMQWAHLLGEDFWKSNLLWLDKLVNGGKGFLIGRNQNSNGVLLPESKSELR